MLHYNSARLRVWNISVLFCCSLLWASSIQASASYYPVFWDATKYTVMGKDLNSDGVDDLFFVPKEPAGKLKYLLNQSLIKFPIAVDLFDIEPPYEDISDEFEWPASQVHFVSPAQGEVDIIIQDEEGELYYGLSSKKDDPNEEFQLYGYYLYELENDGELEDFNKVKLHIGDFDGDGFDEIFAQGINGNDRHQLFDVKSRIDDDDEGRYYLHLKQEWENYFLGSYWDQEHTKIIVGKFTSYDKDSLLLIRRPTSDPFGLSVSANLNSQTQSHSLIVTTDYSGEFNDRPMLWRWQASNLGLLGSIDNYQIHKGDFDGNGIDDLFFQTKIENGMSFHSVVRDNMMVSLMPVALFSHNDTSTHAYQLTTGSFLSTSTADTLFFHSDITPMISFMAAQSSSGPIFPVEYTYGRMPLIDISAGGIKIVRTMFPGLYYYQFEISTWHVTDCHGSYYVEMPGEPLVGNMSFEKGWSSGESPKQRFLSGPPVESVALLSAFELTIECSNSNNGMSDYVEILFIDGELIGARKPRGGLPDGSGQ